MLSQRVCQLLLVCSYVPVDPSGPSPGGVSPKSRSPASGTLTHWCFSHQPVLPTSLRSGHKHTERERNTQGVNALTELKECHSATDLKCRPPSMRGKPTLLSNRSVFSLSSFRSFSTLSSFDFCSWISSWSTERSNIGHV